MIILNEFNKNNTTNKEEKITLPNVKSDFNTKRSNSTTKNNEGDNILSLIYKSKISKRANSIKSINISNHLLLSKETSIESKNSLYLNSSKTEYLKPEIRKINKKSKKKKILSFLKFKCFICDNVFLTLYSTKECLHKFCKICGRNYYEELIELKAFSLKCPKYSCEKNLTMKIIRSLISPFYFKRIKKSSKPKINKINEKIDKCLLNKNIFELTEKPNDIMKDYLKVKSLVCTKCNKPALFGRNSCLYVKCLNCSFQLCKYCFKEYNDEHLNQRSHNYCKIFFRNLHLNKNRKKNDLIFDILCFFASFFVFVIGFTKRISNFFINEKKYPLIFNFGFIFFYIFIQIFSIIILPYYPLIIIMFG